MAERHEMTGPAEETVPPVLPADAPRALHGLLALWQDIAAERPPAETDFPFDRLVAGHPGLGLVEPAVTPEGRHDYRYLRVGPDHAAHTGRDLKGQFFSDIVAAPAARRILDIYDQICAHGQPQYWESINLVLGAPPTSYVRLVLPLFGADGRVAKLLGCWVWREVAAA